MLTALSHHWDRLHFWKKLCNNKSKLIYSLLTFFVSETWIYCKVCSNWCYYFLLTMMDTNCFYQEYIFIEESTLQRYVGNLHVLHMWPGAENSLGNSWNLDKKWRWRCPEIVLDNIYVELNFCKSRYLNLFTKP